MQTHLRYFMLLLVLFAFSCENKDTKDENAITKTAIRHAEKLAGLSFTEAERDSMLPNVRNLRDHYATMRKHTLSNSTAPVINFNPVPEGYEIPTRHQPIQWNLPETRRPESDAELAFYTLPQLAYLIKNREITSEELTKVYISRLKKYSDTLQSLITLTEELALKQARRADQEIGSGNYRGPLHGIPYGVKDLFAVEGFKTTWGATPFRDQEIPATATVVKKLEKAGAVLTAKLTLGALAMGDVWYDGVTRNPWDMEQGSSGSSAGSASSTVAGLVGFSLGTETYGSIVSPSTRCGVTGLRPTFGRVSRAGAMALSWSMDKAGPICRSAKGAAMVLQALNGKDPADPSTMDVPFNYPPQKKLADLKIGYIKEFFEADHRGKENDQKVLVALEDAGAELIPAEFPQSIPVQPLLIILYAEASAAFDALTRSDKDSLMVAQHRNAWPNLFRYSRTIPAVEYIQANRLRRVLIRQLNKWMQQFDVIVTPSYGGNQLLATNLTGHPCVVVPNGFDEKERPTSISFIGNLFEEHKLLQVADRYQKHTKWDDKHPAFFK